MRATLIYLLLASCSFLACNDGGTTKTSGTSAASQKPAAAPNTDLSKSQTAELLNLLSAYYSLKDALVATNGPRADESASKVLSAAELFRNEVGSAPQGTEIHPQLKDIMSGCDSIIAAKSDSVEMKRAYFSGISNAMFKTLKLANLKDGGVYRQYCPMAFNDRGAYWLSAEEEIKNPYFGNRMLSCGEVRDSL